MGKNKIDYYPKDVREAINAALKKGGHTLEELVAQIQAEHGERLAAVGKTPPSKSGLHRYSEDFEEYVSEAREVGEFAKAWVTQIGESPEGDTGQMLVQMMQSAAAKTLMAARSNGATLKIGELKEFSTAVQRLSNADAVQAKRADLIAKRAREALVAEQKKKLDGAEKSGLISAETLATIRSQIYGL